MQNRKCTICSTSKPFWEIPSAYKQFFHRYLPIGCAYSTHRRLELEIWRFSCRRQQQLELYRAHTPRAAVSTTFTYILCQVVRMSRKHMVGSVHRRGQQNAKMQYLRCLWTLPNDSKHNEASFSTISTDILYLRVAQMPRSPDSAIFVLTTDTTDHFTPCACARGKYYWVVASCPVTGCSPAEEGLREHWPKRSG